MTVIETTNAVLDYNVSAGLCVCARLPSLANPLPHHNHSSVHPQSLPTFVRALVANAQAVGGRHWTQIFARENSGTVRSPNAAVPFAPDVMCALLMCWQYNSLERLACKPQTPNTRLQYNNQWMIVDYSLFTPHATLPDGTLWLLEQLPGVTRAADVTHVLRRTGRWVGVGVGVLEGAKGL